MGYSVADDSVSNKMLWVNEFIINEDADYYLLVGECPYCHGMFGIDLTYYEQVDNVVHCPLCCMQVVFDDEE